MTDDVDRQLGRRDMLKRSALLGGTLVWATPVVQSIGGTALADGGSPRGECKFDIVIKFCITYRVKYGHKWYTWTKWFRIPLKFTVEERCCEDVTEAVNRYEQSGHSQNDVYVLIKALKDCGCIDLHHWHAEEDDDD